MSGRCPLCDAATGTPLRGRGGLALLACGGCGSRYLDAQAHPYAPEELYNQSYFAPWDMSPGSPSWTLRAETAAARLRLLMRLGATGRLLDLGCAGGYLVAEALARGFDAHGLEIAAHAVQVAGGVVPGRVSQGVIETAGLAPGPFDVLTAFDVVEHHPEPRHLLQHVRGVLRPGGLFAATVPDLSSLTAALMGSAWPHYKEEHRFYPTRPSFRRLLLQAGLTPIHDEAARKSLSLAYLAPLLETYPVPLLTPLVRLTFRLLPRVLREARLTITIGERLYVARREA